MMDNISSGLRGRIERYRGPRHVPNSPTQSPAFAGSVFPAKSVPTTTGCYFSVHPVEILGTEAEGSPGSLTVDTSSTVMVFVTGGRPPVSGDVLICRFIGNRWVADRLAPSGGVAVPGCFCNSIPNVLTMSSSQPTSNGGMFQNCTFDYGPTPSQYNGLSMGSNSFLSVQSFTDQYNGVFRYYFYCQNNQFLLTRVYVSSIFGSPFRDSTRYTWTMGTAGNSCSPFLLSSGRIYSGGDSSCIVTISA